jgi:hypothetical protein
MTIKDITFDNIKNFIIGNIQGLLMDNGLTEKHFIEQVMYRKTQCPKSCEINKQCAYCGCSYPYKLTLTKSCNKSISLPDIMSKEKWENYKKENKIE